MQTHGAAPRQSGRHVLMTGGSNGIGQAIALRLAADGARVFSLDLAPGADTETRAAGLAGSVTSLTCDLGQPAAVEAALAQVQAVAGTLPTVLVHAAAALSLRPFDTLSATEWQYTQTVNLGSAVQLAQALLPGMRQAAWGRIVLITSSTFWVGGVGMAHYVSSKGGLMGLAHALAKELGPDGITVNCVAPGLTRTRKVEADMSEDFFRQVALSQSIRRNGRPEDHAAAVAFLASDEAGFITGQTLLVDGGQAMT
jgi:NAD(P)-dependent dehydrogenase (short-subunit alcohol dehydrogenase family)